MFDHPALWRVVFCLEFNCGMSVQRSGVSLGQLAVFFLPSSDVDFMISYTTPPADGFKLFMVAPVTNHTLYDNLTCLQLLNRLAMFMEVTTQRG